MCGEHRFGRFGQTKRSGSPPHVRGTPPNSNKIIQVLRITPACAGNTEGSDGDFVQLEDHPRMCGEHFQ